MGRIQSNTGLITGINIGNTVDALMALAARPRDRLAAITENLRSEQAAVGELTALLLAVRYVGDNLGKASVFQSAKATSSHPETLSATLAGTAAPAVHSFIPARSAQRHQLLSAGQSSLTAPLGGGTVTFRFGSHVERSADLDLLGDGAGLRRGKIRITDRSGRSADIDLTAARTLDDVLEAINRASAISVTAQAVGDRIRLIDRTGQSLSNLVVEEVGGGATAASLGLAGIDVAADQADGQDLLRLAESTPLSALNDGNGVRFSSVLPDFEIRLRDGTHVTVDLSPIQAGSSEVLRETTLGEVFQRINEAGQGKLRAEIASDGDRLVVTDLTEGASDFALVSLYDSQALKGLGLDGSPDDGAITGRRILGGMKSVLLSSLDGGRGLGALGTLDLTDRSGATASVDLAAAETLEDVIRAINDAGIGIRAQVNAARNGISLTDTTGASTGRLIVASGDGAQTAEKLKLAVDADVRSVNSGDLRLQVVAWNTRLDDLNGGAGVARGRVSIADSAGRVATLDLTPPDVQTVGDVIQAINRLDVRVVAELNETGDGILLRDLDSAGGTLQVRDLNSTAAADLRLLGPAVQRLIDNQLTQVIDGSMTSSIALDADDSLQDLVAKIQALDAGVEAAILNDGSGNPYRVLLSSRRSGEKGQMVWDASGLALGWEEQAAGRDALLVLAQPGADTAGLLFRSSTNRFAEALPGLTLEIKQTAAHPVTITVEKTDTGLVSNVKALVENYNRFRKRLNELSKYDTLTNTRSLLAGDAAALRLDVELSGFLSSRFVAGGSVGSLAELGIGLKDDGTIELDESKLKARFAADPAAVEQFFTADQTGFSARFKQLSESLSGVTASLLDQRAQALDRKIRHNEEKLAFMDRRLESQRERLYLDFYRMEQAVSKLKSQMSLLDAIRLIEMPERNY